MRRTAAMVLSILLLAAPALASSEGAGHEPSLDGRLIFWKGLNVAILFGVLFHFLKKPVAEIFVSRRRKIAEDLAEARAARDEASRKLAEVEQKISAADAEVSALMKKAEEEATAERELILKAAHDEAARIKDLAQDEIRRATDLARRELAAHAAELATERARELLKDQIRPEDRARLLSTYLAKLSEKPAGGKGRPGSAPGVAQ